jgi:hypothetical protein
MWYKDGTVQVALNSTTVTGTGTLFGANVRVGDAFKGPDGDWYEIVNVPSDLLLSINPAYKGANATDQAYSITPVQGYVKLAADRLAVITGGLEDIDADVASSAANAAAALSSKNAAAASETAAAGSATAAAGSASSASASATSATSSKNAAATSETNALSSKNAAATSATNASTSETNALASKNAAATSATAAAGSATAAATSKTNAQTSETNALSSKNAAAASETAAAGSATAAASSATAAAGSATAAATSKTNAQTSETNAAASATAANTSKLAAAVSEANALASANNAASGALAGLDKMPGNLIANPSFISTASLFTTDVTNGKVSYSNSGDAGVPANCPVARVGVSLKKVASVLLTHGFPLVNSEPRIPCVPGEKFDLCIWMNVVGGLSSGTNCARLVCVESDAVTGGTFIANTRVLSYDQTVGGWQKLTGTFTASATTRSFTIGVWNETAMPVNGTIYFGEPEITRRNSVMGLLGSLGFGDFASPLVLDLNANTIAGPMQCLAAVATAAGLPNNVSHTGIHLRQSATSHLQIMAPISSVAATSRKLFWRNSYNSVWTTWSEVVQSNAGTLIDAILTGNTTFSTLTNNVADTTFAPTSSDTVAASLPAFKVAGLAGSVANAIAAMGFSNSTANFGSTFIGTRSYGAAGAHGAVASGRSACTLMGAASDGVDYRKIGRIDFYTEEIPTATSAAGQIRIMTTPVGAILPTLAATFTSDNKLNVVGGGSYGGNLSVTGDVNVTGNTSATGTVSGAGFFGNYAELGKMDGTAYTPFIDFHSGATVVDYDTRIISSVPNGVAGGGLMDYIANGGHRFTGNLLTLSKILASGSIDEAATVSLASAATVSIANAASNTITVTGTVGITSLGAAATAGIRRQVKFAAALTLTHNATSLILPTLANITTAANDVAEFLSLGGSNWLCTSYSRANGKCFGFDNVDNTSDANKPISTATATALAGKQASLGYTPVQQGTGVGQSSNTVKIGWTTGSEIKITIDSTDMGAIAMKSYLANSATIAAAVAATGSTLVQRDASGNITGNSVSATGTMYSTGQIIGQSSMELGNTLGSASTPFIDFHSGATAIDYDTRILSDTPNGVSGGGRLQYIAGAGHLFTGPGNFSSLLTATSGMIAKAASAGVSSPYYFYGEASQLRGCIYGMADNVLYFQAGASITGLTVNSSGDAGVGRNLSATGTIMSGSSITAAGNLQASGTVNGVGGTYSNNSLCWSRADFNPNNKLDSNPTALAGTLGRYNVATGYQYDNYTAANQVYNSGIELREQGLVQGAGPAPSHIYNSPGITFHWGGMAVNKLMMSSSGELCFGNPNGTFNRVSIGGDIWGTTWGSQYLSSWIAANCLTLTNFRSNLANLRATELGSFVQAAYVPAGPVGLGGGVVGSSLRNSSSQGSNPGAGLPGNYDCCGYINTALENTLWHRYV